MGRVAVLSGSFRPGLGYQENVWSAELARRGHRVRIFAPSMSGVAHIERSGGCTVEHVPARGLPERNLFHTTALAPAVRAFDPDLVLWFGPPQRFGVDVARDRGLAGRPLVAFMGQNRHMQAFAPTTPSAARQRARAAAYRLVRGPAVALAVRRADGVVCTTPETADLVLGLLPPWRRAAAASTLWPTPLGFDPTVFGHRPAARPEVFSGRIVAAISSRFAPEKAATLEHIRRALEQAMDRAPALDALWVGFDDGPVSRRLGAALDASRHRARMHRRPFGDRAALAGAFRVADLAVFARPSISAQEALGTGAYGVLADGGSMDWLLEHPDDGRFFEVGSVDGLADALVAAAAAVAAEGPDARAERAARARRLGYDRIVDGVLARLGRRNPLTG